MAGGGGPLVPTGRGGKKAVDFQLNLIPMIDLLSVLISFLLINAVWTQIARIEVRQQANVASETPPLEDPEKQLNLTVFIGKDGYSIFKQNEVFKKIDKEENGYNSAALAEVLRSVAEEHDENRDVTITSEDKVSYEELIRVMDLCLQHNLDGISVSGAQTI